MQTLSEVNAILRNLSMIKSPDFQNKKFYLSSTLSPKINFSIHFSVYTAQNFRLKSSVLHSAGIPDKDQTFCTESVDLCCIQKNFQRSIICSFNIYSEIKKTLVHFMTFGRLILEYKLLYLKAVVIFY